MKANFKKMTQSTNTSASTLPLIATSTPLRTSNHLKREYAWHVASNLLVSFQYAWAGVSYAFSSQRNFRIHTFISLLAISLGWLMSVTMMAMAILTLTCALVMVLELLNTALESVVDLTVGQSYHELARIAKDCAAGAVMISAIAALLVAGFILLPPLIIIMGI